MVGVWKKGSTALCSTFRVQRHTYVRATSVCELSDLPESVKTRSPAYSSILESYQCLCIPELSDLPESVETRSPAYSSILESYQCLCIPELSDPPESETRNLAC